MSDGERPRRIGVLGGTLDPVHVGHVDTALAAQRALGLDQVILMPARVPPHRQQGPAASPFQRFAMAALAVNGLACLTASDEELSAEGPSYTALTLERFAARGIQPSRIFFITGADAFAEIGTWYRYPRVLDLSHFVVVARPGTSVASLPERLPALRSRFRAADAGCGETEQLSIFLVNAPTRDVSSTDIRRRLGAGQSIAGLVPDSVERHILQHRLYAEGWERG